MWEGKKLGLLFIRNCEDVSLCTKGNSDSLLPTPTQVNIMTTVTVPLTALILTLSGKKVIQWCTLVGGRGHDGGGGGQRWEGDGRHLCQGQSSKGRGHAGLLAAVAMETWAALAGVGLPTGRPVMATGVAPCFREKERDNVCVREKTGRETENVSENVSGFVWLPKHCTENIIATRKESWPNFELRFVTMYVWTLLRKNKNTHNWITCVSINQVFKYTTLSPDARTVQTQTIVHKSNSIYRPFAVGKPPLNRTSFVPYLPNWQTPYCRTLDSSTPRQTSNMKCGWTLCFPQVYSKKDH